jgi:hypothetical protein
MQDRKTLLSIDYYYLIYFTGSVAFGKSLLFSMYVVQPWARHFYTGDGVALDNTYNMTFFALMVCSLV